MIMDPISDMFARIRNASLKFHEKVDMPYSKLKADIARLLKDEGYVSNYRNIEDAKQGVLRVYLKYTPEMKQVIKGIKRISKSSLRVYKGYSDIPVTIGGLVVTIISTPNGLMTDREARKNKIGGEVLGCVW